MSGTDDNVDINYLKRSYKNSKMRYVIQEAKFYLQGKREREVICVKGSKDDLDYLLWRLKLSMRKINGELVVAGQSTDITKKAVYIYYTSKIPQEFDKTLLQNQNTVIIFEDSREFTEECIKVDISG